MTERTAVAYLRVSTGKQLDGLGLEVQEASVARTALRLGYSVDAVFVDEGVSGSLEAYDRPGMTEALGAVKAGADLIVPCLDRLARSLTVQEAIFKMVWDAGQDVIACDIGLVERDDPDDPMRTAMRQMAGVFAQLERAMIAKRLRDGRKAKSLAGGYAYGAPPFGWKAEGGELVPIPEEQEVRTAILRLAKGKTIRQVAAEANRRGFRTRAGGEWSASSIHRMLKK